VEWVETTGRTVEDAKEAALDQLGVDESDAEFEVLEEARAGLFGRLRGEARVRARVRPTAPRAKDDRRDRRRRARTNGEGKEGSARAGGEEPLQDADDPRAPGPTRSNAAPAITSDTSRTPASTSGNRETANQHQPDGSSLTAAATPGAASANAGDSSPSGRSVNPRRQDDQDRPAASRPPVDDKRGRNRDQGQEGGNVEVPLDEQGQIAQGFLTQLVAEFGLQAAVSVVRPDDETVDVQLEGPDLGLLIGQRGATLLALQDLTRTVVHHRTGAGNGRIHVDVGGYRQKRTEALVRFAQQVAGTVHSSGTRTVLEPMTAADRKVVHDAITPIDGVSTISEGEEPQRRVVVIPVNS
jgi:spoIIIJ-associated protein